MSELGDKRKRGQTLGIAVTSLVKRLLGDQVPEARTVRLAPVQYGDQQPGGSGSAGQSGWHVYKVKGTGTEDGIATGDFVDGIQTEFVFEDSAGDAVSFVGNSAFVYLNGVFIPHTEYTEGSSKITFGTAPPSGATLMGKVQIG